MKLTLTSSADSSGSSTADNDASPDAYATLRAFCQGVTPLSARLEPWMAACLRDERLQQWVQQYGSPLNVISTAPMTRNIGRLRSVADKHALDFQVFFARKANKCLSFIDQAIASEIGVDTASENELIQSLQRGVSPDDLICTAAIKDSDLIDRCLRSADESTSGLGVVIAVDNHDELNHIVARCRHHDRVANIALRLGGFQHLTADQHAPRKLPTRFGFDVDRDTSLASELSRMPVNVAGLHFHLDGYDASQRVSALPQTLRWLDQLRQHGHRPTFVDMGGGFPMSYLDSSSQWESFWRTLKAALRGDRAPVTRNNHSLGLVETDGEFGGKPNVYPSFQRPTAGDWLSQILSADCQNTTVAEAIRGRQIQLRCEPGRSLLDGCGMTVARVEFRKRDAGGQWLIGLSMNRTQCRTTFDDFLLDPILVPNPNPESQVDAERDQPMSGYLVGGYCTESEFLTLRQLHFPAGVRRGDLVVFPNTAGYLMHFLESRSHQFPLAQNVRWSDDDGGHVALDAIDSSH